MSDASKDVLETLSERGYRVTKARERIIAVLEEEHTPLSIKALAAQVSADEASVYRTVKLLVEEGLAEEIPVIQGKSQYALAHGHHHHVVCTECGLIAHVPCQSIPELDHVPENFAVINCHEVTYYGVCKNCVA